MLASMYTHAHDSHSFNCAFSNEVEGKASEPIND